MRPVICKIRRIQSGPSLVSGFQPPELEQKLLFHPGSVWWWHWPTDTDDTATVCGWKRPACSHTVSCGSLSWLGEHLRGAVGRGRTDELGPAWLFWSLGSWSWRASGLETLSAASVSPPHCPPGCFWDGAGALSPKPSLSLADLVQGAGKCGGKESTVTY